MKSVIDKFRDKSSETDVKRYCSKFDCRVLVRLTCRWSTDFRALYRFVAILWSLKMTRDGHL